MFKLRNRLFSSIRTFSSAKSLANDEVLFDVKNNVGIITLNRPRVLNSLNANMVKMICGKLKEWEHTCSFVIVQGAGEKAFCAGGDVVAATKDKDAGKAFFRDQYAMDYLIGKYRIPYVSIIDGVTMGGGVGLSVHGKFRIATERTLFVMSETAIGLFPDVGGSYFLPKLAGKLGLFLCLTGFRLQAFDVVHSGIATHFIFSQELPKLTRRLINKADPTDLGGFFKRNCVGTCNVESRIQTRFDSIDGYFGAGNVVNILKELYRSGGTWEKNIAQMLKANSPTSLAISKRALDLGQHMDLKDCLKMEYRLVCAALDKKISPDFYEGVRAQLIDKDESPKWKPNDISAVSDEMINKAFELLPPDQELDL